MVSILFKLREVEVVCCVAWVTSKLWVSFVMLSMSPGHGSTDDVTQSSLSTSQGSSAVLLSQGCSFLGHLFAPFHAAPVFPFVFQILVKLCSFVSPAEELAQKDDLQLLFSAITSWCPPYNLPWRKSAGEVLMTISRHGLSVNVVKYIHGGRLCHVHFRALSSAHR